MRALFLVLLVVVNAQAKEFKYGEDGLYRESRTPIDDDCNRTMCEIVTVKGYPCKEYFATTSDGYILGMFRMEQNGPPVLLQHGLLDSSFTWVLNYPDQSLPYILYDLGYDVWMGNNRGNTYSKNHTTLSIEDDAFWQFSWDEMAEYDFPTQIDFVLQENTQYPKLVYIGHSEGTTQAFAGLTLKSNISNSLYGFIGLGPVVSVNHMTNLWLKDLLELGLPWLWNLAGINQFFPTPERLHSQFVWACAECPICCNEVIELICGRHHGAFNNSRMDVMSGHEPGGTSVQNIHHWAQMAKDGTFQMMNFGRRRNREKYGQASPPVYDLTKLPKELPMVLYSGSHDELADPEDVNNLVQNLYGIMNTVIWKEVDKYAHLDFAWALDAPDQIYIEATDIMRDWVNGL